MPVYRAKVWVRGFVYVNVNAISTRDAHKKVRTQLREVGPDAVPCDQVTECQAALDDVVLCSEE